MIMTIIRRNSIALLLLLLTATTAFAGNPDRVGQAGAYELLINPYAASSGLHSINTSRVKGIEAMRLNVAGLSHVENTELIVANSMYLRGSGTKISTFGFGQQVGESGVLGVEAMSMNWGDIPLTTVEVPSGELGNFSPRFFNLSVSYAQKFSDFISAGLTVRMINESIANLTANGVSFDAGVQYTTGAHNNFKFGVALRNIGTPMVYSGDGLSLKTERNDNSYQSTLLARPQPFELPSLLHIGASYDFFATDENKRLTLMGNFQSNSFSTDIVGLAAEFAFLKEHVMARAGYQISEKASYLNELQNTYAYSGFAGGLGVQIPKTGLQVDFSYRATTSFDGTMTFGGKLSF